jgi:hypothetical protein
MTIMWSGSGLAMWQLSAGCRIRVAEKNHPSIGTRIVMQASMNAFRIVAQCFTDKLDVTEEMAKSGTVCDWPKFSGGHYKVSDKTCSRMVFN